MPEIYVDADACPVKDEVMRVARRHGLVVHMVSNSWMRLPDEPNLRRVVVDQGPDVADDWIVEHVAAADIVVTRDIGLAARCLDGKARVIDPAGKPFTEAGIGSALAMRDFSAHLRETGEIRGNAPMFSRQDRLRFLDALEREVQASLRSAASKRMTT